MWKTQNSHNMLKTIQLAAFISLSVASFAAEFLPVNDLLRFPRTNEVGATLPTLAIRSWFIRTDWHSTLHCSSCVLLVGLHPATCHLQYGTSDWGGLDAAHLSSRSTGAFFFFFDKAVGTTDFCHIGTESQTKLFETPQNSNFENRDSTDFLKPACGANYRHCAEMKKRKLFAARNKPAINSFAVCFLE